MTTHDNDVCCCDVITNSRAVDSTRAQYVVFRSKLLNICESVYIHRYSFNNCKLKTVKMTEIAKMGAGEQQPDLQSQKSVTSINGKKVSS